jgi:hypothetical protein
LDLIALWDAELARLSTPEPRVSLPVILGILQGPGSEAADSACSLFAATLAWPPLEDPVRLEVLFRLCCARWYCSVMPEHELEQDETPGAFAESVLIEYWRDAGREDWVREGLWGWTQEEGPPETSVSSGWLE